MLMSKIESEKSGIMAEIEAGKKLQKDRNAPSFISQNIQELENKLKNTNDLAQAKHTKLKVIFFVHVCVCVSYAAYQVE